MPTAGCGDGLVAADCGDEPVAVGWGAGLAELVVVCGGELVAAGSAVLAMACGDGPVGCGVGVVVLVTCGDGPGLVVAGGAAECSDE